MYTYAKVCIKTNKKDKKVIIFRKGTLNTFINGNYNSNTEVS